jgi:hypothetical protein
MGSYMYCDHNVDFGGDLGNIKLKILIFFGEEWFESLFKVGEEHGVDFLV